MSSAVDFLPRIPLPPKNSGAPDIIEEIVNHVITLIFGKGILLDSEEEKTKK